MTFKNKDELIEYLEKEGYNPKQIEIFSYIFRYEKNIYPYINKEIGILQLEQILAGLKYYLDISYYDDYKKFTSKQMDVIRKGLMKRLDVSIYAKPEYTPSQMLIILQGLIDGIDVSLYADYRMSVETMEAFYKRLLCVRDNVDTETPQKYGHNNGRFNLELFKFQRVDFEGRICSCHMNEQNDFSLLVKPLYWQGEYVCDHMWISLEPPNKRKIRKFNFGDYVSFSAEVEPYLHKQDNMIHYGLNRIRDIRVLYPGDNEIISIYGVGSEIHINVYDIHIYNKKTGEQLPEWKTFAEAYHIPEDVKKITFKLVGLIGDNLLFEIHGLNKKCFSIYAPFNKNIYFSIGKSRYSYKFPPDFALYKKLGNTYFHAKRFETLPLISGRKFMKMVKTEGPQEEPQEDNENSNLLL